MNCEMNVSVQRFSPSSPVTIGTRAASGARVPFQHAEDVAAGVVVGVEAGDQLVVWILGLVFQPLRVVGREVDPADQQRLGAPVERTTFTSLCIPTVV